MAAEQPVDFQKHLLIDGYNIIHAWPWLRAVAAKEMDTARGRLAEIVRPIHDNERIRVTVVFDGKGENVEVERPGGDLTFSLLFSPSSMSADELIEQLVGGSAHPELFSVATRDQLERQTVEAHGAVPISPDELAAWAKRCLLRQQTQVREQNRRNKLSWGNRLEF